MSLERIRTLEYHVKYENNFDKRIFSLNTVKVSIISNTIISVKSSSTVRIAVVFLKLHNITIFFMKHFSSPEINFCSRNGYMSLKIVISMKIS